MARQYLGIEIGGTKLQLAVGAANSTSFTELVREDVDAKAGASGIVKQIESIGAQLINKHDVAGVGIGFGGPVDIATGRVTTSHQIHGWDEFPLGERLSSKFQLPVQIDNDCNVAALGEAKLGAGQGASRVFYVTVGTGIGGGFVIDGKLDGNHRPAISEIGHLRPGLEAISNEATVESIASGWGIARAVRTLLELGGQLQTNGERMEAAEALLKMCDGDIAALTTKQIGAAATAGNEIGRAAFLRAAQTLGWAIAQVITLAAPDVIVVGGGVSLVGATFFEPLREATARYAFAPLANSYRIEPAQLGEEVVLYGALLIAAGEFKASNASE